MSGRKEICTCGHEKATHHAEIASSGDVTNPAKAGQIAYRNCLAPWCNCERYESELIPPDEAA